ncbi:MAG: biliverdin-producing heme oxygenase [Terricaulis sp.]
MKFPDRRRTLRQRTAAAHAALETHVGPFVSRSAYVRYCRGLHGFRASLEPALDIFARGGTCGEWRPVTIAGELTADLADLNARSVAPLHIAFTSADEAIGGFYVLEGSALGARLLITQATTLGFTEWNGARHLARQAATLANWRGFLDMLESLPHLDMERAVAGASIAFEAAASAMARACFDG